MEPPLEYVTLFLCRDVYHCTPQELDQIPLPRLLQHLRCLSVEAEIAERRQQWQSMKRR